MNTCRRGQRLTTREREILGAIAMGETPHEIGERLCISPKTVHCHLENVRTKLGARTTASAVYEYVTRYQSEV